MFNFYRCFIPKAAHILAPIVQFLEGHTNQKKSHCSVRKSSEPLTWNENAEQAFLAAKNFIGRSYPFKTSYSRGSIEPIGNSNKCSPRQLRHLDLISQYSTDIRHVQGFKNTVADALSRIEIDSITKSPILNFKEFASAQKNDPDVQKFLLNNGSSLK
ncbi:pro-Pol polyprotein [Trichonephila clavipes]|nr:pro-Pol polyprotein [Trichonephila clavipes]